MQSVVCVNKYGDTVKDMNRTAIVTGANGFVGAATVRELVNNGYHVWCIVHNSDERISDLDNVEIIRCEMDRYRDLENMIDERGIDSFFHFAWAGSWGEQRGDVKLQLSNVQFSIDALNAAKTLNCKNYIGAGTINEKESVLAALTSGNKPGLNYIYGYAKLVSHLMCSSIASKIGIDLIWPIITNSYGIGDVSSRFLNSTFKKCLNSVEPEFTSGIQNYDFVYIDDVARAYRLISEKGRPFTEYLIGSSDAKPLKEFLLEMKNVIAPDINFKFGNVPFTGINLPLDSFDCSMTEKDTGFRSEVTFAEGCKKTYEWLSETYGAKI